MAAHFAGETARFDIEIRIVPHGDTRWVHLTGLLSRDATGKPVRWTGSVADITERRRAAEELHARQNLLDLAQNVARAVAFEWRVGAGEGENRWSPDLEAMYGVAPGSYDGTYESWKRLVHPDDWPKVRAAIKAAQANRRRRRRVPRRFTRAKRFGGCRRRVGCSSIRKASRRASSDSCST